MSLVILLSQSNISQLMNHFVACDDNYFPPLSSRVNLQEYATKIFNKALRVEAWDGDFLVAIIACYLNHDNKTSYITDVSVNNTYAGKGVASSLLEKLEQELINAGIKNIQLEVNKDNNKALELYKKFNFEIIEDRNSFVLMEKNLV